MPRSNVSEKLMLSALVAVVVFIGVAVAVALVSPIGWQLAAGLGLFAAAFGTAVAIAGGVQALKS